LYNIIVKIYKGMTNLEIAEVLRHVAASYKLKDEKKNRFKIIAYERASDAVEHLSSEAKDLWDDGKLKDVAGIGESIAAHLDEIFRTGKSKHFSEVMKGLPESMFELMKVPGIGAKTAFRLSSKFKSKISASDPIGSLEKLAHKGEIAKLPGMGEDSQDAILKSIKEVKGRTIRLLLPYATQIADEIIEYLLEAKFVKSADALGSVRRKASTVGDVDIACATNYPKKAIEYFTSYPKASRVLEKGERTAGIVVAGGRQVDLMVETPDAYGALLQHFTGSKHHNIALRELAIKKGFSLSDYGIYIKKKGKKILKKIPTEEEFYKFIDMDWIPPELREDMGEIEAALNHTLPKLVDLSEIKGDLQIHSDFDIETSHDIGESTMFDLVAKANELGYEYIAFTEHNPSRGKHSDKQIIDILKRKKEKIYKLNNELRIKNKGLKRIFNSLEIDMLPSGKLPVPDEGLELLDFALVSIHSSFRQSRDEATNRVIAAMSSPKVKIFAHPTGRKLGKREGVDLNWEKILEFCKSKNKWLEINAEPMRLDLPDILVKDAVNIGIKLTLGTDAHHVNGMDNMPWGVSVARRGWAQIGDIVNTRSLEEFERMLEL